MTKYTVIILALTVCQAAAAESISSSILSVDSSKEITKQCSRDAPGKVDGHWLPSRKDIEALEANLHLLSDLESSTCCGYGKIEGQLEQYHLQYAGIIVNGNNLIYINAFLNRAMKNNEALQPYMVCDGGKTYWGAIYDPNRQTFSDLAFNGSA